LRFAGRFWHAKHLYKDCAPKGGNCLQVWHGWKLLELSRLAKFGWGRGLLFFGWGMGNQVAGLPEGTFRGSIDFQNAFALGDKSAVWHPAALPFSTGDDTLVACTKTSM